MKNVIFNSLPAMVEALNQEIKTIRGWSFVGIENYHSKGTGERANYLINISPNIGTSLKRKEMEFWNKYAENPFQNALDVIISTYTAKGEEVSEIEIMLLRTQAEAYRQNLRTMIASELVKDGDTEYWNASEEVIGDAVFALNYSRKHPNPNRRRGALNSYDEIGDTGLRYFDNTENYALYGLKVNKRQLSPPTNPKKQGARELTRGKDFLRAKYLKGRRQFILSAGMAIVVNKKRFLFIPDGIETTASNEPTPASIELGNLQASTELRVIQGESPENILSV